MNAFLFNASFTDGLTVEIQVNCEFGSADAAVVAAEKSGRVVGRLPHILGTDVQTVAIYQGVQLFAGGIRYCDAQAFDLWPVLAVPN